MPSKEYYAKNRDKYLEYARLQRRTPEFKALIKKYKKENPHVGTKSCWRSQGIICDYDTIYDIYINTHKCDHCNKDLTNTNRTLDHCHSCGTVRGILCRNCNRYDRLKCYLC